MHDARIAGVTGSTGLHRSQKAQKLVANTALNTSA